ncbi:MAG: hypothetical protein R2795_13350 [Saprospiraceae bacterium]
MANQEDTLIRYSDEEVAEFRALVEEKLKIAEEQLIGLQEQILEISENSSDEHGGDWVDDSAVSTDMEMMANMASRQQKYVQELHNALMRIRNKTYGICVITGGLIDKRRLLAVPTTTKSLIAKTDLRKKEEEKLTVRMTDNPYVKEKPKEPKAKIITKVVRKTEAPKKEAKLSLHDDDDDDLLSDDLPVSDIDFTHIDSEDE